MAKNSKAAQEKKSHKQAVAIGLSEAREAGMKAPERKSSGRKSSKKKTANKK